MHATQTFSQWHTDQCHYMPLHYPTRVSHVLYLEVHIQAADKPCPQYNRY